MLFVSCQKLLASNLFRILITFQCCLLVLFGNCLDVRSCLVFFSVLIRYQRNPRCIGNTFNSKKNQARRKIIQRSLSSSVHRMLDPVLILLCISRIIRDLYMITILKPNCFINIYIPVWHVRSSSQIFIYVKKSSFIYLSKHTIGSKLYDQYNFACIYHKGTYEESTPLKNVLIGLERSVTNNCFTSTTWVLVLIKGMWFVMPHIAQEKTCRNIYKTQELK